MLFTALFATSEVNPAGPDGAFFGGGGVLLGKHLVTLIVVVLWFFFGSLALYRVTDLILPLRVDPSTELQGLDANLHGETVLTTDDAHQCVNSRVSVTFDLA
jgi:ammonium transporter, Amt family